MSSPTILVLILASDNKPEYVRLQEMWRKYMHRFGPQVTSFFYKGRPAQKAEYVLDGDTLFVRAHEGALYQKLQLALKYFEDMPYDYLLRPNVSSFVDFPTFLSLAETWPREGYCYAVRGILPNNYHRGVPQGTPYPSGACFTLSSDLAKRVGNSVIPGAWMDDVHVGKLLVDWGIEVTPAERVMCEFRRDPLRDRALLPNASTAFHFRVRHSVEREVRDIIVHRRLLSGIYGIE